MAVIMNDFKAQALINWPTQAMLEVFNWQWEHRVKTIGFIGTSTLTGKRIILLQCSSPIDLLKGLLRDYMWWDLLQGVYSAKDTLEVMREGFGRAIQEMTRADITRSYISNHPYLMHEVNKLLEKPFNTK